MHFAFALFSPDCVLSGTIPSAIKFMTERGVRILAHRWHHLSVDDVAKLYKANRSSRPATLLDALVDELFCLSASLCCLVSSEDRLQDEALHRLLLDIKGPSDPFNCRPSQLRRALGATNKILNLVHTSDTPADSLREGALFFPEIRSLVTATHWVPPEAIGYEYPHQLVSLSGFRTVNDVKRRVLLAGATARESEAVEHFLELERQLLESQPDHVTVFPQLQKILGQQTRAAATMKPADLQTLMYKLISISARTANASNGRRADSASVKQLLNLIGVGLSQWESLVIDVEAAMPSLAIHGDSGLRPDRLYDSGVEVPVGYCL